MTSKIGLLGQPHPSSSARWRDFALTLCISAAVALALNLAAVIILDPYDTGRFLARASSGVTAQGPRTANASRARDPRFDAAIFGNSHVQLLEPARLDSATGFSFVSLIVPATGPREQFVLIDWYLRNRVSPPRAMVLGIDGPWCTADPALPTTKPFPYWLYDSSPWAYLKGLLSLDVTERLPGRISLLLGRAKAARADGYWNYEPDYVGLGYAEDEARARLQAEKPFMPSNPAGRFPAAERLRAMLARVPAETAVVLVRPPVYATALPKPGTPDGIAAAACRDAFAALARERPRTVFIDRQDDRAVNRDPASFFDHTHYRAPVAREIETAIAEAVRGAR